MLRELEGMNVAETAAVLGIQPATVKTRLHRAKNLLRGRLTLPDDRLRAQVFAFAGARCDAIVGQVFAILASQKEERP